ncbi:MAG: hypothetical protein ACWGSQ_05370 [Longimicrobiales bacterium]
MSYVPIVPSPPSPPSPRTRELAALLTKVLEEYKKSHPATSDSEIRAAVRLAQLSSRSGNQALPALLSVGLGLLVAGVLAGVLVLRSSGGPAPDWSGMPMVVMAVIAFLLIVLVLVKASSR